MAEDEIGVKTDSGRNINKLAVDARIYLSDEEKEALARDIATLYDMADALAAAFPAASSSGQAKPVETMSVADLREDTPIRDFDTEALFRLSPTAGDDGYIIPRLLE